MDLISDEVFDGLRENYRKVRQILKKPQVESDLEEDSSTIIRNEALEILRDMQIELEKIQDNVDHGMRIKYMLSSVHLDIGAICDDNKDVQEGKENVMKCLEILEGHELNPEGILIFSNASIRLYNILWDLNEHEDSKLIADRSNTIYKKYKNECVDEKGDMIKPVGRCELFGIDDNDEDTRCSLDGLNIMTLCFLAQVYSAASDRENAALYSHKSLQKQLELADCDYINWAIAAATLSQFFMERKHFTQARHDLAAATYRLKLYEKTLSLDPLVLSSEEIRGAKFEELLYRSSDIARCWAKYGISLMSMSKDRLLEEKDDTEYKQFPEAALKEMKFTKLEKEIESIEAQITDKYLLDFEDAKKVFLNVQKWLDEAKEYYNFDTRASDYVEIVQDHSEAYSYLVFFEADEDRQAKMHKRRIDILEEVITNLNPKYYQAKCRQIYYELGDIYSTMSNIKWEKLKANNQKRTSHVLNKINHLSKSSIKYYQLFLDSIEDSKSSSTIVRFSDEFLRHALFSHLHIGTLYNRMVATTDDKKQQLENSRRACAAYRFIVDYCECYPDAAQHIRTELVCCKEFARLLPMKISKLEHSVS